MSRYIKLQNESFGIDGFENVNGKLSNNQELNLKDAMELLMALAGSRSYCIVSNEDSSKKNHPINEKPTHLLWVDTSA